MFHLQKEQPAEQPTEQPRKQSKFHIKDSYKPWIVFGIAAAISFAIGVKVNYVKNVNSANTRLQELVLFINNSCYHIHHSMWMLLIVGSIAFGRYVNNIFLLYGVVGFLVGASSMDLLFPKWYVVKNLCHRSKIIKFFKTHPLAIKRGRASSRT